MSLNCERDDITFNCLSFDRRKAFKLKNSTSNPADRLSQKTIPEIKLCGKWLNDLGFTPAHYVTVTAEEKMLIIRLVE